LNKNIIAQEKDVDDLFSLGESDQSEQEKNDDKNVKDIIDKEEKKYLLTKTKTIDRQFKEFKGSETTIDLGKGLNENNQ